MVEEAAQLGYKPKSESLIRGFNYIGKGLNHIGRGIGGAIKYGAIVLAIAYGAKACKSEDFRQRELELNIQRAIEENRTHTIDSLLERFDKMPPDEFRKLCIDLGLTIPPNKQQELSK